MLVQQLVRMCWCVLTNERSGHIISVRPMTNVCVCSSHETHELFAMENVEKSGIENYLLCLWKISCKLREPKPKKTQDPRDKSQSRRARGIGQLTAFWFWSLFRKNTGTRLLYYTLYSSSTRPPLRHIIPGTYTKFPCGMWLTWNPGSQVEKGEHHHHHTSLFTALLPYTAYDRMRFDNSYVCLF